MRALYPSIMKRLFSAHKALFRRFLHFQQNHLLHGGSYTRFYHHPSNRMRQPSSYSNQMQSSSMFLCHLYSTESSNRSMNCNNIRKCEHEIILRETIKPTSPTPHHLRTCKFSFIDQTVNDIYTPLIIFLPNTDNATVTDVISKRSKQLRETLSDILTQFFPLAGEVKDNLHIDCNDKGVYYMEARVNQRLRDYLCSPQDEKMRELMPESPGITESAIGNYVIGIQVNIFNCGGIALSTSTSHKIVDFHTYIMFMNAWAAAVRGLPNTISLSFVASEVFPSDPSLEYPMSPKLKDTEKPSTKRFIFDSKALNSLKPKLAGSRMEIATSIIWKAAAKAASTITPYSLDSPHAMLFPVNLRKRASPPLPDNSIGNIVDVAVAVCYPARQPDLRTLMSALRQSIAEVNSDHIESMKIKEVSNMSKVNDVRNVGDAIVITSLLNNGIFEIDFGWGKPIWFYAISPGLNRVVALTDTLEAGGIEAFVTLSPHEMELFEHDPDILSYATVNSSPLRTIS